MTKKTTLPEADREAFKEAMRGVKPMTHSKIIFSPNLTVTRRRAQLLKNEPDDPEFQFSDHEKFEEVGSEDLLDYSRSGIQHKILRKLRTGQYNIEAILDLHGMTIEEARHALSKFLVRCKQNQVKHVLMIHGKGRGNRKPILKNKLNHWLRQTEEVLAFCSATAKEGRGGALYVLLRR
jgi:DNA-nicking Smr family endonuclease